MSLSVSLSACLCLSPCVSTHVCVTWCGCLPAAVRFSSADVPSGSPLLTFPQILLCRFLCSLLCSLRLCHHQPTVRTADAQRMQRGSLNNKSFNRCIVLYIFQINIDLASIGCCDHVLPLMGQRTELMTHRGLIICSVTRSELCPAALSESVYWTQCVGE